MPGLLERTRTERVLTTCQIHDPVKEQELLRFMHSRFLEARRKIGEQNGRVSFSDFVRGVATQATQLRKKSGCEQVELRLVVVDRKVQLKARPGR